MPSVSGKDLISDITEKAGRRLIVLSSIVILVKLYKVDLADMSILGLSLPSELFDVVSLCLVLYMIYVLVINWLGDLVAYRLWYSESEIWSQFNTNMKLDGSFIKGGTALLQKIFALEKGSKWPERFEDIQRIFEKSIKILRQILSSTFAVLMQQVSGLAPYQNLLLSMSGFKHLFYP